MIANVTEIVDIDEAKGHIRTRCLWQLDDGERWERPVAFPRNPIVAALYEEVAIPLDDMSDYRDRGLKVVAAGHGPTHESGAGDVERDLLA